ncbi:hypothetical protein [Sporofaciens musculi]|uniref:hypothetical protein n=1 Tax=Sporofaciens musculi TaxID=2681861 RepID=UPI0025A08565|nr:hypothetical protein [Sporofaciens musculi]
MKMTFKAFAKKLFGVNYDRLIRTFFIYLIIFWGLFIADLRMQIAPFILYLMVSAFTAGMMWQALSSADNAANMQNMFMLPFDSRKFVFSYTAALGAYILLTKTAALLTVVLAVSKRSILEILGSILCAVNAVLMTAVAYSLKKYLYAVGFWGAGLIAVILFWGNSPWFMPFLVVNSALAVLLLYGADAYSFYLLDSKNSHAVKSWKHHSVWRYLLRYLICHKNYMMNTVVLWCAACVLPLFFKQTEGQFIAPIGFAILSLNTPICILLSCDPSLLQAVHFLPNQEKAFCIPYALFIFVCNMSADMIFLCSLQIQNGGVTVFTIITAVCFAILSSISSVLLEWFYPIKSWKIENDLWHHPRKYVVPVVMLLLAAALGTLP